MSLNQELVSQTETETTETTETTEITETTETTETTEQASVDQLLKDAHEKIKELTEGLRTLNYIVKEADKAHRRELREMKKSKKRNKNNESRPSGFNKPNPVPVEFHEQPWGCESDVELPRTLLTKMVYEYIKDHNCQDPQDKRVIIPDETLRKLFHLGKEDVLRFETFQTYMARLYKRDFGEDELFVETSESESENETLETPKIVETLETQETQETQETPKLSKATKSSKTKKEKKDKKDKKAKKAKKVKAQTEVV